MSAFDTERVLAVRHWTRDYFSFTTTRDAGLRFENGQFIMIGLEVDGHPLMRAYSIASANWEEELEFFSIKVPDGPLTSRLQHLQEGDDLLISRLTELMESGRMADDLGLPPLDRAQDRAMICGGPQMLADFRRILDARGFSAAPRIGTPGEYVFERVRGEVTPSLDHRRQRIGEGFA